MQPRDDARRDGVLEPQRAAHRDRRLADFRKSVFELRRRQAFPLHLKDGEVGLRVGRHERRRDLLTRGQHDREVRRAGDHVIVRDDAAVFIPDDAAAATFAGKHRHHRRLYAPDQRGDIVVLLYPDDPAKSYIKRVAGLPGEMVQIEHGKLYINGQQIEEPYLDADYLSYETTGPTQVKDHHYFVLGDNRRNSSDSRSWGLVPEKYIYGKAIFRYYPFLPFEHVGPLE